MEELKFATENEALQYLANVTGKSIKVAEEEKDYMNIVFLQNTDDFNDFIDPETKESGIEAFFDADDDEKFKYLYQWEYGDTGSVSTDEPWGSSDDIYEKKVGDDVYIMSYNPKYGYASLSRVIEE